MSQFRPTRRELLKAAGIAGGGAWLAFHWPSVMAAARSAAEAHRSGEPFHTLSDDQAAALEAMAECIIPSGDDGPGAREAGVVHFMDTALGGFAAGMMGALGPGLEELHARTMQAYPESGDFADLDAPRREAMLREVQEQPFFGLVRLLTIWGMFSLPSYGGNRDEAGWKLIGFRDAHGWQPPFGYYDEHETRGEGGSRG